jgi:predicted Fe-Mo cluster-binding NifX family protein
MKIAVSSTGPELDDRVDPRFGRCAYFLIVDPDTFDFEAIANGAAGLGGGAGIQAGQLVANQGAQAVITGNVGPNAAQTLSAAKLEVYVGALGTVRDAVQHFKEGKLQKTAGATVDDHFGMGAAGAGMGMGRGKGRGMGMGRGMRGVMSGPMQPPMQPVSKDEEVQALKEQTEMLKGQLSQIEKRMQELQKDKK